MQLFRTPLFALLATLLLVTIGVVGSAESPATIDVSANGASMVAGDLVPDASRPPLLLPDLRVTPPLQLLFEEDERRTLRFSTTIENRGNGPLALFGVRDPDDHATLAYQRLTRLDGGFVDRRVGGFQLDVQHEHWHFANFVTTEVWTFADDGALETLLASTGKVAFCIIDTAPADPAHPGASEQPTLTECGGEAQAISVGWQDTYEASLPGQALDLTHFPDGRYALRATVDPDNRLHEQDESNNEVIVHIELRGGDVLRLPSRAHPTE